MIKLEIMFRIVCLLPCLLLFNSCMAGNKLTLLERKIYAMETSIQQDLVLLRQNVESNTHELEKLIRLLNTSISDVKDSAIYDYSIADTTQMMVSPSEIANDVKQLQSESQRVKRAFAHEKEYLRERQADQDVELANRLDIIQSELEKRITDIGDSLNQNVERITVDLVNKSNVISKTVDTIRTEVDDKLVNINNTLFETVGTIKMEVDKTLNSFDDKIKYSVEKMLQSELNTTKRLEELTDQVISLKAEQNNGINALSNTISTLEKRSQTVELSIMYGIFNNIRLRNGSASYGRVEVYYNGEWGTVCDDGFDDVGASVVCRSLGYSSGVAKQEAYYGQGSGHTWLDDVQCTGSESNIFACPANPIGVEDCSHHEDVGVYCS